jgi:hypothetical protein
MLAPFATLVFLSAIWLAAVVASRIFVGSAPRIAAALRGEAASSGTSLIIRSRPARARIARSQPMHARPTLRAAA